jgi:hypothetical protein
MVTTFNKSFSKILQDLCENFLFSLKNDAGLKKNLELNRKAKTTKNGNDCD